MEKSKTNSGSKSRNIIIWIFCLLFFVLGVLNIIFVHVVPGIIYLVFSLLYLPATNTFFKNRFGFLIPFALKVVFGLVVLWATLAVGDLMEMFEDYI